MPAQNQILIETPADNGLLLSVDVFAKGEPADIRLGATKCRSNETCMLQSIAGATYIIIKDSSYRYADRRVELSEISALGVYKIALDRLATLDQVTISALREAITATPGGRRISVQQLASRGLLVADILKSLPNLVIDGRGLSIMGRGQVLIVVDGRELKLPPADAAQYVLSLSANQIDQLELTDNIPLKYSASGAGSLLQITTLTSKVKGTNGFLGLGYGRGQANRFNGDVGGRWQRDNQLAVFGKVSATDQIKLEEATLRRMLPQSSELNQTVNITYPTSNINWSVGSDISMGKTHQVNLGLGGFGFGQTLDIAATQRVSDRQNQLSTGSTLSSYNANWQALTPHLTYTYKWSKQNELIFDTQYSAYNKRDSQYLETSSVLPELLPAFSLLQSRFTTSLPVVSFKIDAITYTKGGTKVESGASYSVASAVNRNITTTLPAPVPGLYQGDFLYDEAILGLYQQYAFTVGQSSYSFGVRAEHTTLEGTGDGGIVLRESRFWNILPSFNCDLFLSKNHSMSINYSERLDRPSYLDLNPFRAYNDPFFYYTGNINLIPAKSYALYTAHTYRGRLTTKLLYQFTDDVIGEAPFAEGATWINTFVNLNNQHLLSLSASGSAQPYRWLSIYQDLAANYIWINGQRENLAVASEGLVVTAFVNADLLLKPNFTANFSGVYSSRQISGANTVRPFYILNAGMNYKIIAKLSVGLSANDIFWSSRFRGQSINGDLRNDFTIRPDSRSISVNVRYNFGKETLRRNRRIRSGFNDDVDGRVRIGKQ